MADTRPTGRTSSEIVEIYPERCGNGHPLGLGRMRLSYNLHPNGKGRARIWICKTCGDRTYSDDVS